MKNVQSNDLCQSVEQECSLHSLPKAEEPHLLIHTPSSAQKVDQIAQPVQFYVDDVENKSTSSFLETLFFELNLDSIQEHETFFVELLDFIVAEKTIEFSGWLGDKEHQYGRIAFQFEPSN